MFIKTTRAKNYEYIKLVEAYWEEGRSRQRVLYNFGRADLIRKDESFLRIVRRLCEIAEIPTADSIKPGEGRVLEDCSEATLYNYGYAAYLQLWRKFDIDDVIREAQKGTKVSYSLSETVFLMALQHLLEPRSKLSTHREQQRYFGMREVSLQHMYRALDWLSDKKEEIETGLFQHHYIRTNKTVDVVFYDVTTVHFESVMADELRDFGFSKNCRFNEVQVVMGMIIDSQGLPVGYELFKGNTFDGKTMLGALANIKKRYGINRVIIVADRGLNSKGNLNLIKEAGYGYVMASKVKGSVKEFQERILYDTDFTDIADNDGNLTLRYKIIEHENVFMDDKQTLHRLQENMVVSYSPKRAKKDAADRERLVEKAKKLLENPAQIKSSNKRGGKKYLDPVKPDQTAYQLAMDKIEQDAKFDGYYAIQTSEKTMSALEIMEAYHTLWKIEESFRIMKSTLEVRPVFHWSKKRIEGHFVVCFLAFLMERKMELLLHSSDSKSTDPESSASPDKIREAINSMQLAAVTTAGGEVFIRATCKPLGKDIFKQLRICLPSNICNKDDLIQNLGLSRINEHVQLSLL
jgi:transposase